MQNTNQMLKPTMKPWVCIQNQTVNRNLKNSEVQRLGRKARHQQTLSERYAGGYVNPIKTDQYSNMKSNKQRKRANNTLLQSVYDLILRRSDGPETFANIEFALEFIIEDAALVLQTEQCRSADHNFVTTMKACRKLVVNWLLPSLQAASLRVCPDIMKLWNVICICETLVAAKVGKRKKHDLVWTRLFHESIQKCVLNREAISEEGLREFKKLFTYLDIVDEKKAIVYILIPDNSSQWYVGQTKTKRKCGTRWLNGMYVRMQEHMSAVEVDPKNKHKADATAKYNMWKQIGARGLKAVPICCEDVQTINNLEAFFIATYQPAANRRGRQLSRANDWIRMQRTQTLTPRPYQWQRTKVTAENAIECNFWKNADKVQQAKNGWWNELDEACATGKKHLVDPDLLIHTYKEEYHSAVAERPIGPIDIYRTDPETAKLMAAYIAKQNVPGVSIQTEKVHTSTIMQWYNTTKYMKSKRHQTSARIKISHMLKSRGYHNTAVQHISLEASTRAEFQKIKSIVNRKIMSSIKNEHVKNFFIDKIKFHQSKVKVLAQGFKNMRRVSQEYNPAEVAVWDDFYKWKALHREAIEVNNNNIHIPQAEPLAEISARNHDLISHGLEKLRIPGGLIAKIDSALANFTFEQHALQPETHLPHKFYLDQFRPLEQDEAICTLDRNTRGFARMKKSTYFAHMDHVYYKDREQYHIIYTKNELYDEIRKLRYADWKHRPSFLRRFSVIDFGFEYINLKEKCARKFSDLPGVDNAYLSRVDCVKDHSDFREVSTQPNVDVSGLRNVSRSIDHMCALDNRVSLQSGGLHLLKNELLVSYEKLESEFETMFECQACAEEKTPVVLAKADIKRMFHCIEGPETLTSYSRLAKRVHKNTRQSAIMEKRTNSGRKFHILTKRKFNLKGTKVLSFLGKRSDIHRALKFTNYLQISKLGVYHVKRVKGMAMGHTLSSIKGGLILRQQEIDWLQAHHTHISKGFLKKNQKWWTTVIGARYADDILLISKRLCHRCLKSWVNCMYPKTMEADFESYGTIQNMCDLKVAAVGDAKLNYNLRIRKLDKNENYLLGLVEYPPRARYAPAVEVTSKAQIRSWVVGAWITECRRAHGISNQDYINICTAGAARCIAELFLLGHNEKVLLSTIASINQEEIAWLKPIVSEWLRSLNLWRILNDDHAADRIKASLWHMHISFNLIHHEEKL